MDEQQQPLHPPAAPPVAFAQSAPAPAMELFPTPQPGTFRRVLRLLLIRAIRLGAGVWVVISPYFGWLLAIAFLLGIIGFQSLLLILPRLAPPGADSRVPNMPTSAAVESFLVGQASYNAELMWDALSPSLQEDMASRGGSKEALALQIESQRALGQRYGNAEYVGGVQLENNWRRYFYVVDVMSPSPEGSGLFTFIFTTDRDGKIIDLKMGN